MRESSDDLYISGEYFKNKPTWDEEDTGFKAEWIYNLYKKNNLAPGNVIEVGCGAGGILKELSKKDPGIKSLAGFDISPQAINLAKAKENDRIQFFNKDFTEENLKSDLLLVIDVVEHVDDYYNFLRKLLNKGVHFIFHIPLDLCCRTVLKPHVLLGHRNSAGHIHYFSEEMVHWFLKDVGYEIIDWHFTKPIIDFEEAYTVKAKIKKKLRNLSYRINPSLSSKLWGGYSMLILAGKSPEKGII